MQGTPPVTRRRHRRIGSSASLDSRSSQPSPLKRGDMNASLPATPSQPLRSGGPEGEPAPGHEFPIDACLNIQIARIQHELCSFYASHRCTLLLSVCAKCSIVCKLTTSHAYMHSLVGQLQPCCMAACSQEIVDVLQTWQSPARSRGRQWTMQQSPRRP